MEAAGGAPSAACGREDLAADSGAELVDRAARPTRHPRPALVAGARGALAMLLVLAAAAALAATSGRGDRRTKGASAALQPRASLTAVQRKVEFLEAVPSAGASGGGAWLPGPSADPADPAAPVAQPRQATSPPLVAPGAAAASAEAAGYAAGAAVEAVALPQQPPAPYAPALAPARCGLVQDETEYPGNDLRSVLNVTSAESCCQECTVDPNCVAWTWGSRRGEAYSDGCFLKGGHPRGQLTRVKNAAFTSGEPTQARQTVALIERAVGQSLLCFSLMMPYSYEQGLLAAQYDMGESIFGCDAYAVYSNATLLVAPGVYSTRVDHNLSCTTGGEFKTALNLDIFLAVWSKVVEDGVFSFHDWTVKVDPDCVFFPARLRASLWVHKEASQGTYLNNCKMGMHGPLEVFSRNAVLAWVKGSQHCVEHFNELCSGDCLWGEDMFIDQCLSKVLHVKREDEPALLLEDHCDPPPGWRSCSEVHTVAFHPFKVLDEYRECVGAARDALDST
ncbi:unnamed protein product [Prorocentrum cordatum]|uniref:Apple domain-containing protein n=1 Tax=Prorocentrum cordatum TaxID=2364126 RepID=A0ABN9UVB6_9DINO|nr:unnamed protein product [Polarella glacialis]